MASACSCTEFLFMKRRQLPSEDEQFHAYRDGIVAMAGRPVTLRTLDLGADKAIGGPARHWHRRIPRSACAASVIHSRVATSSPRNCGPCCASAYGPMRILLPMVSSVEEVREARELIG